MKVSAYLKDHFVPIPPPKSAVVAEPKESAGGAVSATNSASTPDENKLKTTDNNVERVLTELDSSLDDKPLLHRKLKNRHIQLIGIGGTIGTALFVSIGNGLISGGPLGLLLGFMFWSIPILSITAITSEMVSRTPIASPFIRFAGLYVDESLEVVAGWNFWFLECSLIPFEIVAVNTIIHFWRDDYSPAITLAIQMVMYFLINVITVKVYGETEFWLSIGKVILAVGLMVFTIVTMCGGNPERDAYGFRNWQSPSPILEYINTGSLGRFQGFLSGVITACFMFAGPEYVSMAAAECENPRKNLPRAYKQVAYRLTIFFLFGAFCVGTICASNDPILLQAVTEGRPGAGSSPYIIAMTNLNVKVLPDIVNALILTAAFSAGNSYTYCSSRALYGLSMNGHAPRFFQHCTKSGVPLYCVLASLAWGLLSFLQLGEDSAVVLKWIVNLVTSSQLINFSFITITYLFFYRGTVVQGIDRRRFPFRAWFQPYLSFFVVGVVVTMIGVTGYTVFLPGNWKVETFLFSYLMVFIDITIYVVWKVLKRTPVRKPEDIDFDFYQRDIEEYEYAFYAHLEATTDEEPTNIFKRYSLALGRLLFGG